MKTQKKRPKHCYGSYIKFCFYLQNLNYGTIAVRTL